MNAATMNAPVAVPATAPSGRPPHPSQTPSARTEEAAAIDVALNGSRSERLRIATRALFRLAKNSEDTTQALILGISLNAGSFARVLARFAADPVGAQLLEERPSIDSKHVDFDRLRGLPDGTLGREYIRFLDDEGLDADFFQAPPGVPPMLAFLAKRIRQSHDLWHVVTGFSSAVEDEIGLQAFTYAQMRAPSALALTTLGLARYGLFKPEAFARAARGRRLARGARWLPTVRWEDLWERPLEDVRAELGVVA